MKQTYLHLIIYIAALLTLGACQDLDGFGSSYEPSLEKKSASPTETTLSVNPTSLSFETEGGSQSITITSNSSWTVTSAGSWCTLSATSGNGNGNVTITASANTDVSLRTTTITIKSGDIKQEVSITQAAGTVAPNEGDNELPNKK